MIAVCLKCESRRALPEESVGQTVRCQICGVDYVVGAATPVSAQGIERPAPLPASTHTASMRDVPPQRPVPWVFVFVVIVVGIILTANWLMQAEPSIPTLPSDAEIAEVALEFRGKDGYVVRTNQQAKIAQIIQQFRTVQQRQNRTEDATYFVVMPVAELRMQLHAGKEIRVGFAFGDGRLVYHSDDGKSIFHCGSETRLREIVALMPPDESPKKK